MKDIINIYKAKTQLEIVYGRRVIDGLKEKFISTDYTNEKSMIDDANTIWRLEKRLEDAIEIHKMILDLKKKD